MLQAMRETSPRTLTAAASYGLCNRLAVLLSGMAIAEATGRQFTMLWPRTNACSAQFSELFASDLTVIESPSAEVSRLRETNRFAPHKLDLLAVRNPNMVVWGCSWLLEPDRIPAHRQLMTRGAEILAGLQPIGEIQTQIDKFQSAHFRPRMIGVHLRRADLRFLAPSATANTACAMRIVDEYLTACPDAGILLCTDDGAIDQNSGAALSVEGVRHKFLRRYGDRIVYTTPRSLDRRDPVAIQDALVDLWLLRQTDYLVGTVGSSFSEMAAFGRTIPLRRCESEHTLRFLTPLGFWWRRERPLKAVLRLYWRFIRPRGVR